MVAVPGRQRPKPYAHTHRPTERRRAPRCEEPQCSAQVRTRGSEIRPACLDVQCHDRKARDDIPDDGPGGRPSRNARPRSSSGSRNRECTCTSFSKRYSDGGGTQRRPLSLHEQAGGRSARHGCAMALQHSLPRWDARAAPLEHQANLQEAGGSGTRAHGSTCASGSTCAAAASTAAGAGSCAATSTASAAGTSASAARGQGRTTAGVSTSS
jgi:hypothetical protein